MALFNARITNTNTVAGILSDFQEKVNQLYELSLKKQANIADRSDKITDLVNQNKLDQEEADKATAAAQKIQSLFN